MEQALLLLGDMADLKSMKRHEVFLSLKRDLALVSLLNDFFFIAFSNHCVFFFERLFKLYIRLRSW